MSEQIPAEIAQGNRLLTAATEFHQLADVPPEVEWFTNIGNPNMRNIEGQKWAGGELVTYVYDNVL